MSAPVDLAALIASGDVETLRSVVTDVSKSIAAPGQMLQDEAQRYMAAIANRFPDVARYKVEAALALWAAVLDVGGLQDFAGKDPLVVDSISVPAEVIFGEIIPADSRGLPRKFCSTMFEKSIGKLLETDPATRLKLQPKAVKAGLSPGEELQVVSYVRGVTPSTAAKGGDRQYAKQNLLQRRPGTQGALLENPEVREVPVRNAPRQSGNAPQSHGLF